MFAVLARLAIGIAVMGALAVFLGSEFFPHGWGPVPPICIVNSWFWDDPTTMRIGGLPTPSRIVPEWYLLPAYGMLRAITFGVGPFDSKLLGIVVVCAAFIAPLVLAFFDWSKTRGAAFLSLLIALAAVIALGWLGAQNPMGLAPYMQFCTALYFAEFLVIFPILARRRAERV